jgi:hypothetical protein
MKPSSVEAAGMHEDKASNVTNPISAPSGVGKSFLLGAVVGAVWFLAIWGLRPLNPFDFGWIVNPFDTDFSFTGTATLRFLKDRWSFPLGTIHDLIYPLPTSVIFTDSIPLLAVLAKLLTPILGTNIQYFGFWGFLCSAFQGGFSSALISKYYRNSLLAAVGSIACLFCPFFLGKMFGHVSMSGQWIILAAMLLIWQREVPFVRQHAVLLWSALAFISVGVLSYFTPMVLTLMCLYFWLSAYGASKRAVAMQCALAFVAFGAACGTAFYIFGGMVTKVEPGGAGYGSYPYSLDGLINPQWTSKTLGAIAKGNECGEAFSWLGSGILLGALFLVVRSIILLSWSWRWLWHRLPFVLVAVILILFAATNTILWGDHVLFSFHLSHQIIILLSSFRTSARFIWPVWFMIVIAVVGNITGLPWPTWRKGLILLALLGIQIWDTSAWFAIPHVPPQKDAPPPMANTFWSHMDDRIKHITFVPPWGSLTFEQRGYVYHEAVMQNKTLNLYWLGRFPVNYYAGQAKIIERLTAGKIPDNELIFVDYIPLMAQADMSQVSTYMADYQLLVAKPGLKTGGYGLQSVRLEQDMLGSYLSHLKSISSTSVIVLSIRTNVPVNIDENSQRAFTSLGIEDGFESKSNFGYAAIINSDHIVYKKFDTNTIDFATVSSAPSIKLSISQNMSNLPVVEIDGQNLSRSLSGMSVVVYNLESKRVTELGSFDLYAPIKGVVIKL